MIHAGVKNFARVEEIRASGLTDRTTGAIVILDSSREPGKCYGSEAKGSRKSSAKGRMKHLDNLGLRLINITPWHVKLKVASGTKQPRS